MSIAIKMSSSESFSDLSGSDLAVVKASPSSQRVSTQQNTYPSHMAHLDNLPFEMLWHIASFTDLQTIFRLRNTSSRLLKVFSQTCGRILFDFAMASDLFKPHPEVLVAHTIRRASAVALTSPEKIKLLFRAVMNGMNGLYDFCEQQLATSLTADDFIGTLNKQKSIVNGFTEIISSSFPDCRHSPIEDGRFLLGITTQPGREDQIALRLIIFGELFGPSMEARLDLKRDEQIPSVLPFYIRDSFLRHVMPWPRSTDDGDLDADEEDEESHDSEDRGLRWVAVLFTEEWRIRWINLMRDIAPSVALKLDDDRLCPCPDCWPRGRAEGLRMLACRNVSLKWPWRHKMYWSVLMTLGMEGAQLLTAPVDSIPRPLKEKVRGLLQGVDDLPVPSKEHRSKRGWYFAPRC